MCVSVMTFVYFLADIQSIQWWSFNIYTAVDPHVDYPLRREVPHFRKLAEVWSITCDTLLHLALAHVQVQSWKMHCLTLC